jgi:hypothetical protein
MKNVELEEEVYLLDNVCSSTTNRLMNRNTGSQRIQEQLPKRQSKLQRNGQFDEGG